MPQIEITAPVSVLTEMGKPDNFGWSRQPVFFYDPALAWAPRRKFSESDRYFVFNPTHTLIFEVRDDGYLGHMGITVIFNREKKRLTHISQTLLPLGSYEMQPGSESGSIRYRRKKNDLDFVLMDSGVRIIKVDIPKFSNNRSLRGKLVLTEPAMAESLVTNLSWRNEKNAFRYSRVSPWFTVEGVVQYGTTEIIFSGGSAWGIFDWNRGVRPAADIRYWAASCGSLPGDGSPPGGGAHNGRLIGFCVGHGSVDSAAGTENAFFADGKLHKLDQVTFHIPQSNWLTPWHFTSNDKRLEMTFNPQQEQLDRSRILFHAVNRRQVYGFFSGKAVLDDGSEINFNNITGFVERCKTRF